MSGDVGSAVRFADVKRARPAAKARTRAGRPRGRPRQHRRSRQRLGAASAVPPLTARERRGAGAARPAAAAARAGGARAAGDAAAAVGRLRRAGGVEPRAGPPARARPPAPPPGPPPDDSQARAERLLVTACADGHGSHASRRAGPALRRSLPARAARGGRAALTGGRAPALRRGWRSRPGRRTTSRACSWRWRWARPPTSCATASGCRCVRPAAGAWRPSWLVFGSPCRTARLFDCHTGYWRPYAWAPGTHKIFKYMLGHLSSQHEARALMQRARCTASSLSGCWAARQRARAAWRWRAWWPARCWAPRCRAGCASTSSPSLCAPPPPDASRMNPHDERRMSQFMHVWASCGRRRLPAPVRAAPVGSSLLTSCSDGWLSAV